MFRHIVTVKWKVGTTDAQIEEFAASLDALGAETTDVLRSYSHGPDLDVRPGSGQYALVADFDDAEGWRAYDAHPVHSKPKSLLGTMAEDALVVQISLPATSETAG